MNNVNNIININFGGFGDQNNDKIFEDPEYKRIFFEFIYASLRKSKNYGKVANIISKEEVSKNIDCKNIPYYNYYKTICNYLRKSEPNIFNKVSDIIS